MRHVSRRDVGAGYDIESVTVLLRGEYEARYIEVKAVSSEDLNFFWSANEIEVAKELGTTYYLYLVPVSKRGKLDLAKLKTIQDPYTKIYQRRRKLDNSTVWFFTLLLPLFETFVEGLCHFSQPVKSSER